MQVRSWDGDNLHCTAKRCRTVISPGAGMQWMDGKYLQRYCGKCWSKKCDKDERESMKGRCTIAPSIVRIE